MRVRWRTTLGGIVLAIGCLPTEPCACLVRPPTFILYGQAPAGGTEGALTTVSVIGLIQPECTVTRPGLSGVGSMRASGEYRVVLSSLSGGEQCFRATFFAGTLGTSDSVVVTPLVGVFESSPSKRDSLRVDIP